MFGPVTLPPPAYQASPLSPVQDTYLDTFAEVRSMCVRLSATMEYRSGRLFGCTQGYRTIQLNPCVWARDVDPHDGYAKGKCHELGHTNGWPADHPRAH